MTMHTKSRVAISILLSLALTACGSSDDDTPAAEPAPEPTTPPSTPAPEMGVFIDSAVIGIGYRTETLSGVTDEDGQYEYVEGETVTFFIGDLEFAPVDATGVVTPLDIAQTDDLEDAAVINMARLLQTLDADGNPDNGITITQTAIDTAEPVDFTLSVADFAASDAVLATVTNGGQDTEVSELVSEEDAVSHLSEQVDEFGVQVGIEGSWTAIDNENELLGLIFLRNGQYLHYEVDRDDTDEDSGMEWGEYDRDYDDGRVMPTQTFDENGDTGLTDFVEGDSAPRLYGNVVEGELHITVDEDADNEIDEELRFEALVNDGIVGSWIINDINGTAADENDLLAFVFFADGTYVHMEVDQDDSEEDSGMEWGTYEIGDNDKVTVTMLFDANGDTGLTDFVSDELGLFMTFDSDEDILTLAIDENGDGEVEEQLNFVRLQ